MIIKWNVDTGYVTRIPDFTLEIDDYELEGLSEEEQNALIDEYVEQEFQNRMNIYWRREE